MSALSRGGGRTAWDLGGGDREDTGLVVLLLEVGDEGGEVGKLGYLGLHVPRDLFDLGVESGEVPGEVELCGECRCQGSDGVRAEVNTDVERGDGVEWADVESGITEHDAESHAEGGGALVLRAGSGDSEALSLCAGEGDPAEGDGAGVRGTATERGEEDDLLDPEVTREGFHVAGERLPAVVRFQAGHED